MGAIQQDPTPDMEPATLTVLADLMLAQAQEMVACKAINDKMKDTIVAKLSFNILVSKILHLCCELRI